MKLIISIVLGILTFLGLNKFTELGSFKVNIENEVNGEPPSREKVLLNLVEYVLNNNHYEPIKLNDSFSNHFFDEFIESIDYNKMFLTQSDYNKLLVYRDSIDEQFNLKNTKFFDLAVNILDQRIQQMDKYFHISPDMQFSFIEKDSIILNDDDRPHSKTIEELKDRWRKDIKYKAISYYHSYKKTEKEKKESDETYTPKTEKELLEKVKKSTIEYFERFAERISKKERKDWFNLYLRIFTETYDPHTSYFAPADKEDFDVSISGKYEGIGAYLTQKDGTIAIDRKIPGGPCYKIKDVGVGDKILMVAQKGKDPVDITGMEMKDAIKLIKGKKGTTVILTLKKVDGKVKDVPIVRDVVRLEETFAKSAIIKRKDKKYGIIHVPKFYFDINKRNGRDCADDVEQEIQRLKEDNIEGLILDLRGNGGGALSSAVKMTGLFIEDGPVVQVKGLKGKAKILTDNDKSVEWDGPLLVLVDELSASASEIVSAALQDYERALIIGSKQSYGKGTVQAFFDLDRVNGFTEYKPLGQIKVTHEKFYRINGSTTQKNGVHPDIVLPSLYSFIDLEKDKKNALKYDLIEALDYKHYNNKKAFNSAIKNSKKRVAKNTDLSLVKEYGKWREKRSEEKITFPLDYVSYTDKLSQSEKESEKFEKLEDYENSLRIDFLTFEKAKLSDTIFTQRREDWHEKLKNDHYLDEVVNVLEDISK